MRGVLGLGFLVGGVQLGYTLFASSNTPFFVIEGTYGDILLKNSSNEWYDMGRGIIGFIYYPAALCYFFSDDVDRFILTDAMMSRIPAIRYAPAHMNSGIVKS